MLSPDLEFFFDPACPFCWITAKWVRVVQAETDITVRWSYISLVTLNSPYDEGSPMREGHWFGRRAHRVIAAAAALHGDEVVGPLYEAIGNATWEQAGPTGGWDAVMAQLAAGVDYAAILRALELDPALASAVDDDSLDHLFEEGTTEALSRTGEDVGTPIITFDPDGESPSSFFGPVISDVPSPAESVTFYRAIEAAAKIPSFSELKRTKRDAPQLPLLANLS
jgi:2-hydroxychromene-2-carboxylate isomerase